MDLLRSLPLGLYLEQPVTWLHKLDPRVKFAWLMSFLTTYILANSVWRVLLVGLNIWYSAAGMATANGLAVDAVVFCLTLRNDHA